MNRVVHFEIHAAEPERCVKFYSSVFDWDIKEWEMPDVTPENRYWMVMTAKEDSAQPGINGGIVVRKGPAPKKGQPVSSFVCTIDVEDLDGMLKTVEQNGGSIAVSKMPIPTIGWLAYCFDTEGNIFGIMQSDEKAQ